MVAAAHSLESVPGDAAPLPPQLSENAHRAHRWGRQGVRGWQGGFAPARRRLGGGGVGLGVGTEGAGQGVARRYERPGEPNRSSSELPVVPSRGK